MAGFKAIVEEKQALLREQPEKAVRSVHAESRLVSGLESRVKVRDFELVLDQQPNIGGTDRGPRPGEMLLAALAACQEVTYRLYADALGIPLDGISVSLTGTSDVRGFLNVAPHPRAGFQTIEGVVEIDSPASDDEIERLRRAVDQHCPVLDDVRNPVSVQLGIKRATSTATG